MVNVGNCGAIHKVLFSPNSTIEYTRLPALNCGKSLINIRKDDHSLAITMVTHPWIVFHWLLLG